MSTLEDKILGEKTHYYCSSSSDDEDDIDDFDKEVDKEEDKYTTRSEASSYSNAPSYSEWDGSSSNTGPKGVLKVSVLFGSKIYLEMVFLIISFNFEGLATIQTNRNRKTSSTC